MSDDATSEPDLFAAQEPPPPEPVKVPLCVDCKLPRDARHAEDAEVCRKGRVWWLRRRNEFEALDWA